MIATTMTSFFAAARLASMLGLAALIPALTFTASCSDSETPTNPSGVAQVAGTWTGNFRIAACTDTLNGAPGTLCANLTGASAPRQPIRSRCSRRTIEVVGNIQFSGWYVRSLVVTGIVQAGGAVILEGTTTLDRTGLPDRDDSRPRPADAHPVEQSRQPDLGWHDRRLPPDRHDADDGVRVRRGLDPGGYADATKR